MNVVGLQGTGRGHKHRRMQRQVHCFQVRHKQRRSRFRRCPEPFNQRTPCRIAVVRVLNQAVLDNGNVQRADIRPARGHINLCRQCFTAQHKPAIGARHIHHGAFGIIGTRLLIPDVPKHHALVIRPALLHLVTRAQLPPSAECGGQQHQEARGRPVQQLRLVVGIQIPHRCPPPLGFAQRAIVQPNHLIAVGDVFIFGENADMLAAPHIHFDFRQPLTSSLRRVIRKLPLRVFVGRFRHITQHIVGRWLWHPRGGVDVLQRIARVNGFRMRFDLRGRRTPRLRIDPIVMERRRPHGGGIRRIPKQRIVVGAAFLRVLRQELIRHFGRTFRNFRITRRLWTRARGIDHQCFDVLIAQVGRFVRHGGGAQRIHARRERLHINILVLLFFEVRPRIPTAHICPMAVLLQPRPRQQLLAQDQVMHGLERFFIAGRE